MKKRKKIVEQIITQLKIDIQIENPSVLWKTHKTESDKIVCDTCVCNSHSHSHNPRCSIYMFQQKITKKTKENNEKKETKTVGFNNNSL